MMSKKPLNPEEITNLFSKLKAETPEYPSEMMAARKAAFLKQAVNIKIDMKGQGGKGGHQGGSSGSSGAALGGGTAAPGTFLQALIGISIIAAMFLAAFAYREQINDILGGERIAVHEGLSGMNPSQPTPVISPLAPVTGGETPGVIASELAAPSSDIVPNATPVVLDNSDLTDETNINGISVVAGTLGAESTSDQIKTNNGLHLGQTPGTPAAPGQGNPGNLNQPDKTEKPPKPEKTDKPPKPEKTKKP